jgi:phosphatidylinositol glycan class K
MLFVLLILASAVCITQGFDHENNWAVLVSSSRYWFNYRHQSNALLLYKTLKEQGIPDQRIILMLADDVPSNPRNYRPGFVFGENTRDNLYPGDDCVDYQGEEVSVESFVRVLTGRHLPDTPDSKKLGSDRKSRVLVYLNGHGGDGFIKFQDREVITSQAIADVFYIMEQQKRFGEILFISDTCQADSMLQKIYTQNVIGISTSRVGQSSYSYAPDPTMGFALLDRFAFYLNEFLKSAFNSNTKKRRSLQDLLNFLTFDKMQSDMTHNIKYSNRTLDKIFIDEFFKAKPEAPLEFQTLNLNLQNK